MLFALLLAACGGGGASPAVTPGTSPAVPGSADPTGEATPQPEPATIRVGVHWTYHVADWVGLVVADSLGYYDDENLTVEFVFLQGSNAVVPAVGSGDVNVGLAGTDSILAGTSQGLPLQIVANHLQQAPTGVIAPTDKGIASFADLKGHSISTAAASPEQALLAVSLNDAGLAEGDVEIVLVDPQAKCTVVIAGQVDACTGQSNFQQIQFQNEGVDATFLPFSTPERPVPGASTFANTDYLAENPEVVTRFLRASMRGFAQFMEMDTPSVVEIFVADRAETDADFLGKTLDVTRGLLYSERTDENGWGWMTEDALRTLHDALISAEVLKEPVDLSTAFTNDRLPEDREWVRP
jgi:NitT/TauT family transport system substrate-binding protein